MTSIYETFVDAFVLFVPVEEVHAHLTERRAIVSKGAIAEGRSRYGSEPAVEDRKLGGKRRQDWKLVRGEIVHDEMRMSQVVFNIRIALDETLHVRRPVGVLRSRDAAEYLQINRWKMVIRIW